MRLIEREPALAALRAALSRQPRARHILVHGEAGAGKSALLQEFLREYDGRVVFGACDNLRAARPLAPLRDWGRVAGTEVGSDPVGSAEALLAEVDLAVVEDAHWADDATLDLLGVLARRPSSGRAALLLTYRDDEVGVDHPLRMLLADLATRQPVRIAVPALSVDGVAELAAASGLSPADLHATTGGNAFFVTECLAAGSVSGSPNVRDAVLGRLGALPAATRAAVEAVAVVPGRCELWLADALGAVGPALDDAVARGLLVPVGATVALRHELARLAVQEALAPSRRRELNARAARALAHPPAGEVDHARVTHHALAGAQFDLVAEHAPQAASFAESAGARSQAVAQLEVAIEHAAPEVDRVALWSRLAQQRGLLGHDAESIAAYERALELARAAGDDRRTGELLARLSVPLSMAGRLAAARAVAEEAVVLLERQPDQAGLALACAQACTQRMLARELDAAIPWGQRAVSLARAAGDVETAAYAEIQLGVARWMGGDEGGLALLQSAVQSAREHGLVGVVAQGLSQIGSGGGEIRRYDEAVPALEECVAWAERYELGSRGRYALAWLGRCQVELGAWDSASELLDDLVRSPRAEAITRVTALTALGRLRARRGDPGWAPLLDEALVLARRTDHLQRLWPVAVARAEAAWLHGDLRVEVPLLRDLHALAARLRYPWAADELAFWLRRAGEAAEPVGLTPFALQMQGQADQAAAAWAGLGCAYEQAVALEDVDELTALATYDRLGAVPAARRIVERRRASGLSVPRGPNAATRKSPAGLTRRELEVLRLVAAGETNAAIAAALHLSPKTVGHHVAHVLEKLQARTRTEAVSRAHALGIPLD